MLYCDCAQFTRAGTSLLLLCHLECQIPPVLETYIDTVKKRTSKQCFFILLIGKIDPIVGIGPHGVPLGELIYSRPVKGHPHEDFVTRAIE